MNTLLVIAVIALWVLVLVLAAVVFALARQVGVLFERVAPAGALMVNQQLRVGDAAPQIAVEDMNGQGHTTGAPGSKQLLFFVAPDCPICKSLLPVVRTLKSSEPDVEVLLMSDGDDVESHAAFIAKEKLEGFDYVLSEVAGRAFGVSKLPYAVLIDAKGVIASLGIVNSREHLESLFEAERLGVASIQDYLQGEGRGVQDFDPAATAANRGS